MKITLPWPPATNNLYAVVRGRKIKSSAGRKYTRDVEAALIENRFTSEQQFGAARLSVTIITHQPTRRNVDLDGRTKSLLDSLTQCGVWDDDSQIDELRIVRGELDRENPHVEIVITAAE